MPSRRWLRVFGAERRLATALVVVVAATLASCRGDTLYDAPTTPTGGSGGNVPPPTVHVTLPVAGAQVLAGRTMRVRAVATDTLGVTSVELQIRGAATATITRRYDPPRDTAVLDTTIAIPAGAAGRLEVVASARNALGGVATTAARSVSLGGTETTPPTVAVAATVPPRMELTDRIHLHITAADNEAGSGIASLGATVLALTGTKPDTLVLNVPVKSFSPAATGPVTYDVDVAPPPGQALPAALSIQVYAFAVDSSGNCAAATTTTSSQRCQQVTVKSAQVTVAAGPAAPAPTLLVTGRSTALPAGTVVADMVPDARGGLLYFSNFTASRVEVLNAATGALGTPVLVGAEPWGIAFNRTSDTLIVANSGGTNISRVPVSSSGPAGEALTDRIRTQNADLYTMDIQRVDTVLDNGQRDTAHLVVELELVHFSDRPQYIGQDVQGRLVYSTLPTPAAKYGTIRVLERSSGWDQAETRLALGPKPMGPDDLLPTFDPDSLGIINIDSMRFTAAGCWLIYDHPVGKTDVISGTGCDGNPVTALSQAWSQLYQKGSDMRVAHFATELLTFSDTSFVATSADHRYLLLAEGKAPAGRMAMWNGAAGTFSNAVSITDVTDNTGDHLVGVDLNGTGSLGTARGQHGVYYFTNDMRLQGSRTLATAGLAGGAVALDPRNPGLANSGPYGGYDGTQLSYVPTANHSIKIYDTVNFAERGEIQIRDNIIGPLKASARLSGDAATVRARLYGVTDGGAVVVVTVNDADIH